MIAVNFSFQGTELVGIAAGESENPEKTIPKAINNTVWRILVFFVLSILFLLDYSLGASRSNRKSICSCI